MYGSARLSEKQTNSEDEAQRKPKAMKNRSDDVWVFNKKRLNIAAIDNGTMVEAFKFLNYYQLATSSHVSKRFRNLIRTHRHKLALLYVAEISMNGFVANQNPVIKIFNNDLSPNEYNEWIVRNGYSKQLPLEGQIGGMQISENIYEFCDIYVRDIYAFCVDPNSNCSYDSTTPVFIAEVELKDETWPVFQHFIRLIMDPSIYIHTLWLTPQTAVFNFLAGAMNPDRVRLQCKHLKTRLNGDTQKFIVWIKDLVRCDACLICLDKDLDYNSDLNCDEELLDLFLTGAPCTSAIIVEDYDLSKVIVALVQKFMDLKSCNEYQVVESIWGNEKDRDVVEALKRDCAAFIAKNERFEEGSGTRQVIEFINNDIEKKLTFSAKNFYYGPISIKFTNL